MARIPLLFGTVLALAACSRSSDTTDAEPSTARRAESPAAAKTVEVDFRLAKVVERHPALDRLLDFIEQDGAAAAKFDGIQLSRLPGSDVEEVALDGANRDAVEGYLRSVFLRKPDLELPEGIDLAFGSARRSSTTTSEGRPLSLSWENTTERLSDGSAQRPSATRSRSLGTTRSSQPLW